MPALLNHLSNLWKRRPEWCASDRLDLRCVSTSRSERSNIGARSSRAKWIPVWNARQSVRWSGRTRSGPFRRMSVFYHASVVARAPIETDRGRDSIYVSKWFGFDDFNFMQDKCSPNYTTDTMQESTPQNKGESSQKTSEECYTQEQFNDIYIKTSKKRKQEEEDDKMLREAFKILTEPSQVTDPYFSYGQHIANELRKYDSHTLIYVKQAINNIIFEADLGKYSPLYGYTTQEPQNFSSSNTDSLASTSTQANEK
ncbi:hypothetical protein HF086_001128 [Spodoptera exigua]|uniref:Uncharacterized protein n=1 Tax=Spodoptera exigua TaxID=7107 RepID=A0A922S9Q6_SPOEX|nr:hypothetical protein HF086_001128 [Spodoptera exigua]